jgi:hypothetical protein
LVKAMKLKRFFSSLVVLGALAAAGIVFAHAGRRAPSKSLVSSEFPFSRKLPPVMLWAWERAEDLRGLDTRNTGVAFLARTVFLTGDSVAVRPRLQPLRIPAGTAVVAVVRLETRGARTAAANAAPAAPAILSTGQREAVARAIAAAAKLPNIAELQVDFDASLSERKFYRELLSDVRDQLPPGMALSITALASWCLGDSWLKGVPVDDAIPMLFRMGVGEREVTSHLEAGGDFREPVCRQSLGISTDEPLAHLPGGRRLYIFNPRAWTTAEARLVVAEASR